MVQQIIVQSLCTCLLCVECPVTNYFEYLALQYSFGNQMIIIKFVTRVTQMIYIHILS